MAVKKASPQNLSAEQRELLRRLVGEQGIKLANPQTIPRRRTDRAPLSFAQQRLWFLSQLEPHSPAYNIFSALELVGDVDVAALERAVGEVVRRHEALRTVFALEGEAPVQIPLPELRVFLPVIDLSELGEAAEERARALAGEEALRPFDLVCGPLLRIALVRLLRDRSVFLMTVHHIVSDGWSSSLLIQEVSTLYTAFRSGRPSPLPELALQYADFSAWQRQHLAGELLEAELAYWRKQLGGVRLLELPSDHPRPAVRTTCGAECSFGLSASLAAGLRSLCREAQASLFMVTLAAFKVLLRGYLMDDDLTVGSPIANRSRVETEGLIGFFVNTLVLRTSLAGEPTFREVLARVRETTLEAYAHQDVPFEKLVDELQPDRDLAHNPLFQILFAVQNMPPRSIELPAATLRPFPVQSRTAKFDLNLSLTEVGSGIEGSLEYNTDLFGRATVLRLIEHFRTLLAAAAARPDAPIRELSFISGAEASQVVIEWNDTAASFVEDGLCLHELLTLQATRTPDAMALVFEGESLTFAELDRWANRLAHALLRLGVGPEVFVGVCLERSPEMVASLLAVLKAGGAYVPLDPDYPADRLAYMLENSGVEVLLIQERLRERIAVGAGVAYLDPADRGSLEPEPESAPVSAVRPENLAYAIYTSGSTGRPKGGMNSHRGIVNRLVWMRDRYGLTAGDRVLQKTPFSFDVSVWEFFLPLLCGARLVLARPGGHQDSAYLTRLIAEQGVTVLHFVPSMLQVFLGEETLGRLDSLRAVICSGEALPPATAVRFFERLGGGVELHNLYGPTEAAVDVTSWQCDPDHLLAGIPIGRPIANLRVHLLSPDLRPVPIGIPGELYITGVGVGRGYLRRPDLTGASFVPDPFGVAGARLYKTGDLCRYRPGGEIEYLGRLDHQVKIRGFRIELGEIERSLGDHPGVSECVVTTYGRKGVDQRLAAYVVPAAGQDPSVEELRAFLGEELPQYMVPQAFVFLPGLPLSPNGKVDRRALPDPDAARPRLEQAYTAPRSETEEIMAGIWGQVLRIDRVGVHDNFFALGGDSILSVRVLGLARERGLQLDLQAIFRHQTIADLVAGLGGPVGHGEEVPALAPFDLISEEDRKKIPDAIEDAYPMARLQLGMLYHMELAADQPMFHNVNSWTLHIAFDQEKIERAVAGVVARHPSLRTSFHLTGFSEPLQLVHALAPLPIRVTDLRELAAADQTASIQEFFDREERARFDLLAPPLIRFHIHQLSDETFQFSLTEHHAIGDGWSLHATLTEIFERYLALLGGHEVVEPPPLRTSYRDFVALERAALEDEACRAFWARKMEGATPLEIPSHLMPGEPVPAPAMRVIEIQLEAEAHEKLTRIARRAAVPFKSVLLAIHVKTMALVSGQDDVLTSMVSNGRPEVLDGEQIRGLFLNDIPFRLKVAPGSWLDLARQTFETEREILPFRRYPMAEIQKQFGRTRLIETEFNYIHFHVVEKLIETGELRVLAASGRTEQTDMALSIAFELEPVSENVAIYLRYDVARVTGAQAEAIGETYLRVFEAAVQNPESGHGSLASLSSAEQRQLLAWNGTAVDYPRQGFHRLFETQAASTPGNIAVRMDGEELTYSQLNARANRLARALVDRGAGPETLVSLFFERGVDLVTAVLATFKAGAAYLPLDPHHPPLRLRQVLEQSAVPVVLAATELVPRLTPAVEALPEGVRPLVGRFETLVDEERPDGDLAALGAQESMAYVIFTSGSTGVPKGAVLEQQGMVNHLFAKIDTLGLGAGDVVAQTASQCFDISVWQMLAVLLVGGRVEILADEVIGDPARLLAALERERITIFETVPSLLGAVVSDPLLEAVDLSSLRWLLATGEALPPDLCGRWLERFPDIPLVNAYGPTECSDDVTQQVIAVPPGPGEAVVPIGSVLPNLQLYVVDPELRALPVGLVGELCVGGVGVGRGYLRQPATTAAAFVPDPFSLDPGRRLYRTGDLVRRRPDGILNFLGRIDHQVKVRGFRIELEEIEAAIRHHPGVAQVVVVVREDTPGDRRLVAYLAGGEAGASSPAELRSWLQGKLPEYMVPSAFVLLAGMPLTPNGKIDRRALPDPSGALREQLDETYVAPGNLVEDLLATIWSRVLGVERVGVRDNFFALGGDSILSLQVLGLARNRGLRIELPQLFQHQTIAELAAAVAESPAGAGGTGSTEPFSLLSPEDLAKLPASVEDAYPMTRLQLGMLYHIELLPEHPLFHNVSSWRLRIDFDAGAMREAIRRVVARHPVLRTSLRLSGFSRPLQLVHAGIEVPLRISDLRGRSTADQEEELRRFFDAEEQDRFDVAKAPLLRIHLHLLTDDTFQFSMTENHAIADGWSLHATLRDIFDGYRALLRGEPLVEPPPLRTSFRDYVALECAAIADEASSRFWNEALRGGRPLEIPVFPEESAGGEQRQMRRRLALDLPQDLSVALQRLARGSAVPLKSVLLAAHLKALGLITGEEDVVTGLVADGRPEMPDADQVRGLFLNVVPLRLQLAAASWVDLVRGAFEAERRLLPYRRYPLAEMQRSFGRQRLLETEFNFMHFHVVEELLRPGGLEVLSSNGRGGQTDVWLAAHFGLSPGAGRLRLFLDGDGSRIGEPRLRAFAATYQRVLEHLAENPEALHSSLASLSAAERSQLLTEWNDTAAAHPGAAPVHRLFETAAESRPEAVAIVCGGERLTYREVNQRADRLAAVLRRRGVAAEARIALFLDRSPAMLVALLGVLKAGGAYVPLEPSHPGERLAMILEDAQPSIVLTEERLLPLLPETSAALLSLDVLEAEPAGAETPRAEAWPQSLAYVIFTSGSTGRPKGVQISHGALTNFMLAMRRSPGLSDRDALLAVTTLTFDIAALELLLPLLTGGRVELASHEEVQDAVLLMGRLATSGATVMQATPATWRMLLDAGWTGGPLRLKALCGGEALAPDLAARLLPRVGSLWNMYGPTETTVWSAVGQVRSVEGGGAPPIGTPIANTEIHLLGRDGDLVPVGVPGELCIGGAGLARGYLGRPDLTAERFVPDPFAAGGARLYRTGDLARRRPDGGIDFLGRLDHQVKVRGFRIELGEIEAGLGRHPDVSGVVAVARADEGGVRLVAYCVPVAGRTLAAGDLAAFLRTVLPDYMVPSTFVVLEALPLTPNGKVDRRALPAPDRTRRESGHVAPRTPEEERLARLWREILGVERVSVEDNFFDLGGDSLLATRLISLVRDEFAAELPFRALFEAPTVAALTAKILARGRGGVAASIPRVAVSEEERLLAEVDEFSEDQLDSLLADLLAEGPRG